MRRTIAALACSFVIATAATPSHAVVNTVVAGPAAFQLNYATDTVIVVSGQDATFVNLDIDEHDVVASKRVSGQPVFKSEIIGTGETAPIVGVSGLAPDDYEFKCTLHGNMLGTLTVVG